MNTRYRVLDAEVDAIQVLVGTTTKQDILDFCPLAEVSTLSGRDDMVSELTIPTANGGRRVVTHGDYLVLGMTGEYFVCSSKAFEEAYEVIETSEDRERAAQQTNAAFAAWEAAGRPTGAFEVPGVGMFTVSCHYHKATS